MTEKNLLAQALEFDDPSDQQAFLDAACVGQPELRSRVEALLQQQAESLAEDRPTAGYTPTPPEDVGHRLGPYKLLQKLGEGGMGVVFLAEQEQPVKRRVAVKIIKSGMDSAHVLARFEQERQALAMMDHPNIAKVLDAGTTDSPLSPGGRGVGGEGGRPFFVMELVKGVPVTKFCDQECLTLRERLELFLPVCQAVQHAHQKGIIHRDLKPSNVLVAQYDGKPVPKVIDFGVAKSTGPKLTERTMFTEVGQIIGTLEYMAPEQAEPGALDIDTRADVYSLGVLLYELLTGTTPLDRQRLWGAAFSERLRLLREEEPDKPSTRLSRSGAALTAIAGRRKIEPAKLSKLVRGELDWIVMKCLDKDRARRYDTANGLARDVQRYLADEPVEACPPSPGYRLRKFARKHRRLLAMAAVLAAVLLLSAAVSIWQAVRAIHAQVSEAAERQRAEDNERQAKESAAEAKAVLAFFQDKVLAAGRTGGKEAGGLGLGQNVKVREAIDAAAAQADAAFASQPLVEASIRDVLGVTYYHLGDFPLAIRQHERALALRQAKLGAEHPDTHTSMYNLGEVLGRAGELDRAVALLEETLRRRQATLGPEHLETSRCTLVLAWTYREAGKLDRALPLFEETFRWRITHLGPAHLRTLVARGELAWTYLLAGKLDLAFPVAEEALKLNRANLGPEDHYTLAAMTVLAEAYRESGQPEKALPLAEGALQVREAKLEKDHHFRLDAMQCLARVYRDTGRLDQALKLFEAVLKRRRAKLGPEHPDTLLALANLAGTYVAARRYADALPLGQELLRVGRRKLPADHATLREGLAVLGAALLKTNKSEEAEPLLRECLRSCQQRQPESWRTARAQALLGGALLGQKKYAEAEPLLVQGYEGMKRGEARICAEERLRRGEAVERLVQLYEATGRTDQVALWRKKLDGRKPTAAPAPSDTK
jgi:serine/threonine protein kinase/tetratricopeptide (TPR) repeat protein